MPRYFFDTTEKDQLAVDNVGTELSDLEEARWQASVLLTEIMKDAMGDGNQHVVWVSVRNEQGQQVFRASLAFQVD